MEKQIKCTNCGSRHLEKKIYLTNKYDNYVTYIPQLELVGLSAYVCIDCGHVEFFDDDPIGYAKEVEKKRIEALKAKEAKEKKEREIAELDSRIEELKRIISDLDSTQRQVNDAKKELLELENKLRSMR